eukprot:211741_1
MQSMNHTFDNLTLVMRSAGYESNTKIADTLQGTIWKSIQKSTNTPVVIKVTRMDLHERNVMHLNGKTIKIHENILQEKAILQYLSNDPTCPDSIVQYIDAFKSHSHYFLVMEYGGCSFFDFIRNVHHFINTGRLEISEWHRVARILFVQMIECIEYIHSKGVCHFDISLENFLINDMQIIAVKAKDKTGEKIRFVIDDEHSVRLKLCDFGLSTWFRPSPHTKTTDFHSNKYCGKTNYFSPEIAYKKARFCAKSNDIWCLGVVLFAMLCGGSPWYRTTHLDEAFNHIIKGDLEHVVKAYNKTDHVNKELMNLFDSIFKFEEQRITMEDIKKCSWLID